MKDVVTPTAQFAGLALASTFTMELIGVPLSTLICALAGAVFGAGWAKPNGPVHAAGLFFASSLLSSVAGHAVGQHYASGALWASNIAAAGIAIGFHPGLRIAMDRFGSLFDAALRRFGIQPQAKPEATPEGDK